jgi:hypothetical protein
MDYEKWLKTISDRWLIRLWVDYCAPSEGGKINPDKACMIDNEMTIRGLL